MFDAFLAKIGGSDALFDRQFMVAYWSPMLVGLMLVLVLGIPFGYAAGLQPLVAPSANQVLTLDQVLVGLGGLILITALAYLLMALTDPIFRTFEGFWPRLVAPLERRLSSRQGRMRDRLFNDWITRARKLDAAGQIQQSESEEVGRLYRTYFYQYPRSPLTPLRPTLLGNILAAAEEYPRLTYGLDGALWWPRLVPILPSTFQDQVDVTKTPMLALLNLAAVLFVVAVGECAVLGIGEVIGAWTLRQPWWVFVAIPAAGIILAYGLYRSATAVARTYGNSIRVGFDLYRHELLKQLDIARPHDLVEERKLWLMLDRRIYLNKPPLPALRPSLLPGNGIEFQYSAVDSSTSENEAGTEAPPGP